MIAHLRMLTEHIFGARLSVSETALALAAIRPNTNVQASSGTEHQNLAAVRLSFDDWRSGTGSPYDLLASEARWTIEGRSAASRTYQSKEAFIREVIRPFNSRMQLPLKPMIHMLHASGGTVVAFFDTRGVALDGTPYVNAHAWFLEMRAGQIIRASDFFDAVEFDALWTRIKPPGQQS